MRGAARLASEQLFGAWWGQSVRREAKGMERVAPRLGGPWDLVGGGQVRGCGRVSTGGREEPSCGAEQRP